MKNSLIKIEKGNKVLYNGEEVVIQDFVMTPNGVEDQKLVCIVYAVRPNGNTVSATSDKFLPYEYQDYKEFYPTVHLCHLTDQRKNRWKNLLFANLLALPISMIIVLSGNSIVPNHGIFWGWTGGCIYWATYLFYLAKHNHFNL